MTASSVTHAAVSPGPFLSERATTEQVAIHVPEGEDLSNHLVEWVGAQTTYAGVAVSLVKGEAMSLRLMTGKPTEPGSELIATYAGPFVIDCPARIVEGGGFIGPHSAEGRLHAHIHGVFQDAVGRLRGCHLIHGACIAGAAGIDVVIHGIKGAQFVTRRDEDTGFDIFFPERLSRASA